LLPADLPAEQERRVDIAGAITVTVALMLAVYAIVNGNAMGWTSSETLLPLLGGIALVAAFVWIEARVRAPLMPLPLFALRSIWVSNVVGVLWAASMFAWFFLSALYMQRVLGAGPLEVGLAFLPSNVIMAVF